MSPGLQYRRARAVEPVALLHRDAADRLAAGILDDADTQRLQFAVELGGDSPFRQQLRRRRRIIGEELSEDWLWCLLRHRRRECGEEQPCRKAAHGTRDTAVIRQDAFTGRYGYARTGR